VRVAAGALPFPENSDAELVPPFNLLAWVETHARGAASGCAVLCGPGAVDPRLAAFEYRVEVVAGPQAAWEAGWTTVGPGELLLYQLHGGAVVELRPTPDTAAAAASSRTGDAAATGDDIAAAAIAAASQPLHEERLRAGSMLLVPGRGAWQVRARFDVGCACLLVTNSAVVAPTVA